jgi:hypothetical protein
MAGSAFHFFRNPDMTKVEIAIICGQAVMVTAVLVAGMLFDVYAPAWMWN